MKKILVTGAAGQVGTFLLRRLSKLRLNVIGLDIKDSVDMSGFDFIKADLTNKDSLEMHKSILKNVEAVIHLATVINSSCNVIEDAMTSIDLNIQGTLNLLKFLPNTRHICFASSYMIYGRPHSNLVKETHTTEPGNIYGASKLIAEKFLQVYANSQGIRLNILRFMGIYGPATPDSGRAIPSFINMIGSNRSPTLFGTGKARRNHIYIDDAVEAILTVLRAEKSGIFNIGGKDAPSNLELVTLINEIMGKKVEPVFKEARSEEYDFILDISRARDEMGFLPVVDIRKGLIAEIDDWLTKGED